MTEHGVFMALRVPEPTGPDFVVFHPYHPELRFRLAIVESNGRLRLRLTGPTGQCVHVQRSDNLRDWEDWQTVILHGRPRPVRSDRGPQIHGDLGTLQYSPTVNGPWTDLPVRLRSRPSMNSGLWRAGLRSPIGEMGSFRLRLQGMTKPA
jgi:hypothetical protein